MSLGANRRADNVNRRITGIVAVAFLALGALAWAAGWGAFTNQGSDLILSTSARTSIDARIWIGWITAVAFAAAVLVLSVRWLSFELRPLPAHPDFEIDLGEDLLLHVDADAWLAIVVADIDSLDGITSSRARLHPNEDDAVTIDLVARVDRRTDPEALGRQLDTWVRKRAEHSLERPVHLAVELDLSA